MAGDKTCVVGAELDARNVAEPHQELFGLLDDDRFEFRRTVEVGLGEDREFALGALDATRGHFDVLAPERVLDVGRRQLEACQSLGVEPDAHREAVAEYVRTGNAGDRLHPVLYQALGDVGDLDTGVPVR